MHTLRPYQREACIEVCRSLSSNPLLVAPTGAGKTTMGVYLASVLRDRGVVWLAHREELITQAAERFTGHGISVGIIKASQPQNPNADVQVASVQTLARREQQGGGVFIIDEAHRCEAASYKAAIPSGATVIGLTATPFRYDGKSLGETFGSLVPAATTAELINNGTLIEPEVWVIRPPDMTGVSRRAGEYATAETATRTNTEDRRADIVKQYLERVPGTLALAFGVNIEHSKAIADAFNAAGTPAMHVDAETPSDQRRDAIARLAAGDIHVLSNVGLFTEGFDLPAIETIIDAAPTDSLGRHLQKIGRCMRRADGKFRAVVHDHAGNHLRLGRVTQQLTYSLAPAEPGVTQRISEPLGLVMCPDCYRLYAADACPGCGRVVEPGEAPEVTGRAGMTKLTEEDIREAYFDRLCEEQMEANRKDGWIGFRFKEKYGEFPATCRLTDDGPLLYVNPDRAGMDIKRAFYRGLLAVALDKGFKHGWASVRFKDVFGTWPKGFVNEVKADLGVADAASENNELQEVWR